MVNKIGNQQTEQKLARFLAEVSSKYVIFVIHLHLVLSLLEFFEHNETLI